MSEAMKSLTAQGLEQLCSRQQLHLLNAVDSLRSQGVSHYISLPQIIVCGDQSSGKSSVLESISGVSFPVKSSLCTRFPTELILRKTAFCSINVSIVPHHSRNQADKERLSQFNEKLLNFKDLPALIETAKTAMGVATMGKAFSEDILRVEVNGPDRPELTIVDLPGLIHSENKHQSESDIQLIKNVVQGYMKESRSIILAVVSAKNDYANQIVLKLARDADPRGTRTLGVITKPDTLIPGSGSEGMFVSLAKNQDVEFRLGWHVLRNCDTEAENWTFEQRDAAELEFLSSGAWADLSSKDLGIKSLRSRLSKVLVRQIAAELPNLIEEIAELSSQCQKHLEKLGSPRTTIYEQRMYLIQISQSFQVLLQSATHGTYNEPYFGDCMSLTGYQKRTRAVVQNLNRHFAEDMAQNGRRYKVVAHVDGTDSECSELLTRADYIERIVLIIQSSRGRELPGMFNPMIVTELFKELSSPWSKIAESHIQEVWRAVRLSLSHLVAHIAESTTAEAILNRVLEPKLESFRKLLYEKLSGILEPHRSGHPITYNHYFTETLQNIRQERERSRITALLQEEFGLSSMAKKSHLVQAIECNGLIDRLVAPREPDMDHFAASEALDCLKAYYKVAVKRFIDDVAVEVVETCLLEKLGEILDPTSIIRMSDAEVSGIAVETEQSRGTREKLERKLKILKSGSETCKEFAALYVNVWDIAEEDTEAMADRSIETGGAPTWTPNGDQEPVGAAIPVSASSENRFSGDEQGA
ncbi:Dynamin, GTPase domain protein [Cordyceps fumosorosea ARSEF 2679]|uniref:Dynamin, GTPase domain protein n=1 Tax=Cordyceps fumosorosea (strain ARSEF 2679) TaxID=1081104 RepID=A0A168D969_CORFA|nr:Dynamin, GTPase domain protein [Cordyceps fumosorosea ARSEF 2679]OAA72311.1 Dynamin, GTPase domain protein [Cordyceps fumosorosea ARSEF 2679]